MPFRSGVHQNRMRDYGPTTGRYVQGDPLGLVDGASVYGYALQNPGRWVDPRGEYANPANAFCFTPAGAAVCGGGLVIAALLLIQGEEIADACGILIEELFPATPLPPIVNEVTKENPPNHPDYQPHKKNAKKQNKGYEQIPWMKPGQKGYKDKHEDYWQPVPDGHKGSHAPHWDVQHPNGGHTTKYPEAE